MVVVATLLFAGIAFVSGNPHSLPLSPAWFAVAAVLFAMLTGWAIWVSASHPWLMVAASFAAFAALSLWPGLAATSFLLVTAGSRGSRLWLYGVSACALVLLCNLVTADGQPGGWGLPTVQAALGGATLFVVLPMVASLWVAARRRVVAELRQHADELERGQAARTQQAQIQERTRIAREMHDVVAHRVSLMVLHAGALEVNIEDEALAAEAALIHETGREALAQLRDVLGILRSGEDTEAHPDSRPLLANLDRLLDDSRAAGLAVRFQESGPRYALPTMVEHTAYRVIQEALTNVHKHAGAVIADVELRYRKSALEVEVRNPAPSRANLVLSPRGGLGLLGLRERVELVGGDLETGPQDSGGFRVHAKLPVSATPAVEAA
ncbi:hypothetical protein GCM10012284_03680 [Mangrovihabitans endophyticus]|uniref:histidine kinase n=1 Tax=Mangrovihabitans endophyticus TaxID=1751298 RepID=A0A8J3FM29_9ACTN|nr:hypothetical protein GCM10012284_03680 [Mangrovihabitans endophyticus]